MLGESPVGEPGVTGQGGLAARGGLVTGGSPGFQSIGVLSLNNDYFTWGGSKIACDFQ